ncbi:MAG: tRNA (adenosine(37)-N6)-threonylcarbamoyltransferase complex dimerization subunit type 1 TsaB [Clostridia bacterium]|nr:tRNA (adenosine(37)-N6)-threonylcarbamoyltransferase complex dimerization subunit type 1 TsaB [Clostridia bacterium]
MRILGIECTASPVSCALVEDGKLKAEFFLNLKTTHSQTLLPMVESVLKLSGIEIGDVDAVAATVGPGSFTGVRIGISAVKGLCFADKKPCIPVSVLEAMAYGLVSQDCYVCAAMDARCNQVYNALFEINGGSVVRLCDDRALMIDELIEDVKKLDGKPIFIVGDGADLFFNSVKGLGLNVSLAPEHLKWQRASGVCFAALPKLNAGETVDPDKLLPFYLRLPQAERELKAKMEAKS